MPGILNFFPTATMMIANAKMMMISWRYPVIMVLLAIDKVKTVPENICQSLLTLSFLIASGEVPCQVTDTGFLMGIECGK